MFAHQREGFASRHLRRNVEHDLTVREDPVHRVEELGEPLRGCPLPAEVNQLGGPRHKSSYAPTRMGDPGAGQWRREQGLASLARPD